MAEAVGRDLLDAARAGDRAAVDRLIRDTYADTYTLAYRLTGNEQDALDVTQEAYLRAWRALGRFRGDARFTTWLYRITANCAATVTARRARARTEELAADAPVADLRPGIDPEAAVSGGQERLALAAAISALPWRLRQVLVLRDVYDLPHRSIAEQLGISEAAAKVRLHRARRRLQDQLAGPPAAPAAGGAAEGVDRAS